MKYNGYESIEFFTDPILKFSQLLFGPIKIVNEKVMGRDRRSFLIVIVVVDVVIVPVVGIDDFVGDASGTRLIGRSFHFAAASQRFHCSDVAAVVR